MNTKIGIAVVVLVVALGIFASRSDAPKTAGETISQNQLVATIYKSPTCGCCSVYGSYMKKEGYDVEVSDVSDMTIIKERFGIPRELESCHTMEVDGYVVEGHIPEEAVEKLLRERPDIKGIGLPDMPAGSPGMPGPKTEDFVIYEINHDGTKGGVFMQI